MKFLDKILSYLKGIKCKSKCCSGSECMCGTLEDNVKCRKEGLGLPSPPAPTCPRSVC